MLDVGGWLCTLIYVDVLWYMVSCHAVCMLIYGQRVNMLMYVVLWCMVVYGNVYWWRGVYDYVWWCM